MRGSFESGVGEFHGEEMFRGRPVRLRFLWTGITDRTARWGQAYHDDRYDVWETNWTMDLTRAGE